VRPSYLRDLFGHLTEYMPKKKAVKQVASVTERWCGVLQVTTALHSLPIRHVVRLVLSYQEEP
jgi:hypothetical protein